MSARVLIKKNLPTWIPALAGAFATANIVVSGSKVFLLPLLFLGLLGWVHFASKRPAIALIIIVFFAEECFDMFTFGIRQRLLTDISIALMLPLIILNIRRVWNSLSRDRSPYAIAILLFFCAVIISLYAGSSATFGQPITVGLTVARKHLLFLSYFFLVAVNAQREDCFLFLKYLSWLGASIAFLSIVEVALGGGVIFSHYYAVGQERAGMLRIHIGTFLIVFSVIYSFIRQQHLPKASKERLVYLGLTGLGIFTLCFIVMTRALILGLFITLVFWLIQKISRRRIMFTCAALSFIPILTLSGIGNTLLTDTFVGEIVNQTSTELGTDTGNISIRKEGAKFYLQLMLANAPLTGVGLFSKTNYPNNPVILAAERYSYYIVDSNGITTIVYFGLQGAILLLFFIIKSLYDTRNAMRKYEHPANFNFEVLYFLFIYILCTPTLNNIIVERMLIYSGAFFYLLSLTKNKTLNKSTDKIS